MTKSTESPKASSETAAVSRSEGRVGKKTVKNSNNIATASSKDINNIATASSKDIKKSSFHLQERYTEPGLVFVVGSGDCAQLGLGPDIFEKERPGKIAFFDELEIVWVVAGGLHTLALSKSGKVYSWGCNDQKALGRSGEESEPALVEALDNVVIVDIACGDSCSVALAQDGTVYAWGTFRGTNGIFGFAPGIEVQDVPFQVPDLKGIVHISAGTNHIIAVSRDGKIFSWGIGEQGQLSRKIMTRNALDASLLPRPINFKPYKKTARFKTAFCAGYHTFLVHESNAVYSVGLNNYGQLGVGDLDEHDSPTHVEELPDVDEIVNVSGGEHFSAFLTSKGQVWMCGRNDSGQLGLPNSDFPEHNSTPTHLSSLPPIKYVSCGSAFSLAISKDGGNVWAWGYGEMGQLSNESQDAPEPFEIDLKGRNVICVGGGGQHTVLLLAPKE